VVAPDFAVTAQDSLDGQFWTHSAYVDHLQNVKFRRWYGALSSFLFGRKGTNASLVNI